MFTVIVISAVMVNIQKFSFLTVFCEKPWFWTVLVPVFEKWCKKHSF